ncbi:hypothetical protein V5O48_017221 [Marasmius crinis-equi]|uniref:Uncharacterized protein n=1 Tax=Marasmius crinis-equi TaxID=585013 RepID=A0ABR3EPL9_9AGAR
MKKLAARDFEDILQCAIPCFEQLFPKKKDDKIVQDLLFDLATWHAYAKLRLHTDSTVASLKEATRQLGQSLRSFRKAAKGFDTHETPKERAARQRREAQMEKKLQQKRSQQAAEAAEGVVEEEGAGEEEDGVASGKKKSRKGAKKGSGKKKGKQKKMKKKFGALEKPLNVDTAKVHFAGDYAEAIVECGTTDSYTTRNSECQHQQVKHFYRRSNRKDYTVGSVRQEQRSRIMRKLGRNVPTTAIPKKTAKRKKTVKKVTTFARGTERLNKTDPSARYHIGNGQENRVFLADIEFVDEDGDEDPALKDFIPKLQNHLLHRIYGPESKTEYTTAERSDISFTNDCIYAHKIVRVNYNTYDRRRSQDSISTRTHPDMIMLNPAAADSEDVHPYLYAQVLSVAHTHVQVRPSLMTKKKPIAKRMDFLWVRYYELDTTYDAGFGAKRLYRVFFPPAGDPNAFGFVDPADVIRGAHLIPAFSHGPADPRTTLPPWSCGRQFETLTTYGKRERETEDWKYYHVNKFADRDFFMRYRGGAVGHVPFHKYQRYFEKDAGLDDQILPQYDENGEEVSESLSTPTSDDEVELEEPKTQAASDDSEESGSEKTDCSGSDEEDGEVTASEDDDADEGDHNPKTDLDDFASVL